MIFQVKTGAPWAPGEKLKTVISGFAEYKKGILSSMQVCGWKPAKLQSDRRQKGQKKIFVTLT